MTNSFAALREESDSESDVSDVDMSQKVPPMHASTEKNSLQNAPMPPPQSGGSFAQRRDPLTGVSMGGSDENPCDFDSNDIDACLRVVKAVGANMRLFKLPQLKPLRAALHPLILEQLKNYEHSSDGKGVDRKRRGKRKCTSDMSDDIKKLQKKKLAAMEEEYINQTQLRAMRIQQLEKLNDNGYQPRVPDGVAICDETNAGLNNVALISNMEDESIMLSKQTDASCQESLPRLVNPISCYICHKPYLELHFFYHQLCPDCASFNFAKRDEKVNMKGKCCLVTGGRTKIGYRSALKLLRCGARVIVTTRFPCDAAKRYAAEADSKDWIDKLDVYGLDFRDLSRLEKFCSYMREAYDRLDVIINNACQTVRRPPMYYQHLIADEMRFANNVESNDTEDDTEGMGIVKKLLHNQFEFSRSRLDSQNKSIGDNAESNQNDKTGAQLLHSRASSPHWTPVLPEHLSSVHMSQLIVAPDDEKVDIESFPSGSLDVNKQQIDLRKKNSWTMKLDEVSTPELAEVFAINAMAPTILNSRLKELMIKDADGLKFIVNVSAMEGKFYRYKSDKHPHTNMAKAALNMLTRTSAQDYVKSRIYMTAVDTGWINDEKPINLAVAHEKNHNFQTPLDEIDAAARVLDPVIAPLKALEDGEPIEPPWGVFLKDFMKCEW